LSVLTIRMPALRERPADILPLAEYLLARMATVHGRPDATLNEPARKALAAHDWPGNVRELKNAIERALVFANKPTLGPEDFPENIRTASASAAEQLFSLDKIEQEAITATLEATRYKITRAAEILGISRKTLLDKRKKYGLR
jgi:DNA-binding NtrC family response regulator